MMMMSLQTKIENNYLFLKLTKVENLKSEKLSRMHKIQQIFLIKTSKLLPEKMDCNIFSCDQPPAHLECVANIL